MNQLIELDKADIGIKEQEIYSWLKGFITGKLTATVDLAGHCGISEVAVDKIISAIERKIILSRV